MNNKICQRCLKKDYEVIYSDKEANIFQWCQECYKEMMEWFDEWDSWYKEDEKE